MLPGLEKDKAGLWLLQAANPTLPQEEEGGTGEGRSLLGAPGATRVVAGAGQVVMGEKERWVLGEGEQQCQGCPWLSKVTQERAVSAPGKWELETGVCLVLAAEAAQLNVSFVPPCPGRWREVGRAGGGHSLLRICFAHSPRIGGRELQARKSLKSLLQSSWAARAGQPGHLGKAVSLLERRLGVPQLKDS